MGRKAKEAAQQKIGEWTGARRSMSKTTTNSENTNASNENSIPLKPKSQQNINAMKNCAVVLEKIGPQPKTMETVRKTPAKKVPATDVITKDNQTDKNNVYDIDMMDMDEIPLKTGMENVMKDLFDKLAKENKIEVKKYRPKNVKKKKTDEKMPAKKLITQKRRREKQPIDVEPPQKKPNLKTKMMSTEIPKSGAIASNAAANHRNIDMENLANYNHVQKRVVVIDPKGNATAKAPIPLNSRKQVEPINTAGINTQPRLRNRNLDNFQSTPISSTPLGIKTQPKNKENVRLLNSSFFHNESPLTSSIRSTRGNLMKQRIELSEINDSQNEPGPSTVHKQVDEIVSQPNNIDDNDFDFGDNVVDDFEPDLEVDKENSLHAASTSSAAMSSHERIETIVSSSVQNIPKPSTSNSRSYDEPSTSSAVTPPRRNTNEQSIIDIQNESDYNIYSPTKRRIFPPTKNYGRTPLKNITNNVNNMNSPSYESMKSVPSPSHSGGMLTMPSFPSNVTNSTADELTLPKGAYFESLRDANDFDRNMNNQNQNLIDDCFGFDIDDDEEIDDNSINKQPERVDTNEKSNLKTAFEKERMRLKEVRAKAKCLLRNPMPDESLKKAKMAKKDVQMAKKAKTPVKRINTPVKKAKTPVKKAKTPMKNVVFGETGARQKDIRNAFTMKSSGNDKHAKATTSSPTKILFGEDETVQDRRRSYSRPQRRRKRRVSIDTDESEEEQHTDDEDFEAGGKTSKRAKRRKKTAEPNPIEIQEFEEFVRITNADFDEVDNFEVAIE